MRTRPAAVLLITVLSTALAALDARADTFEVATGDFTASEWFTRDLAGLSGSGLSSTATVGGNPGAFRRIELTVAPLQSAFQANLWSAGAYTPASTGPVTSATMSFDFTRVATTLSSASQVVGGIALLQGGSLQLVSAGVTALGAPAWTSTGSLDLLALFPTVNWNSGGEIVFGFYNIVTALSESFTIAGGYDNFRLSLEYSPRSVPLPVSWPLMLSALFIAGLTLRRRAAAG